MSSAAFDRALPPLHPVPSASSSRRRFAVLGATIDIHATLDDTGSSTSVIELGIPPRFPGAPPHLHQHMTESFYVLEGTIEVSREQERIQARRGDFLLIPPHTVHAYRNATDAPARFLVMAPGHDRFFFELVDWMHREPVWPPTDRQALIDFGRRHDTIYV
ncbi:cupin domain-containing protein [Edaphobacter aggregans]|uniref:cupin domain-containing protein n=1 Tax=Edaphobacter aggregans TaxID=570835 RepID=UPI00068B1066|nr:cupin domain-containing protein [Edaphobacter aggregans]